MSLSGEVSDLSLGELIEFFCNQRKTGRLKLIYPAGPAYFYLQSGAVVHARIGDLRGIEAVFYALTLPNASFTFSPAFESPEQTINQPWTSVVLEGLRRMDEGVKPRNPFLNQNGAGEDPKPLEQSENESHSSALKSHSKSKDSSAGKKESHAFLAHTLNASQRAARPWNVGMIAGAVVLIIAAVGVPWGWYARSKAKAANQVTTMQPQIAVPDPSAATPVETATNEVAPAQTDASKTGESSDAAAKRQRDARMRELLKAQAAQNPATLKSPVTNAGAKRVTVQVTYDENGRVTQASGGDPTALRIARQKRFPAGKPGSATITIPIN
jgi:hypothetical protein